MWVRGLKPKRQRNYIRKSMSHPMWVRGLKLHKDRSLRRNLRRTPCGCVD